MRFGVVLLFYRILPVNVAWYENMKGTWRTGSAFVGPKGIDAIDSWDLRANIYAVGSAFVDIMAHLTVS